MILTYIDCLPSLKLMSYFTSFEETELVDFGPQDLFNWREPVFSKPGCHVPSMAVLPCPFPFGLVEVRLWSITCGWCFSWNLTDVFVCKQLTSSTSAKCRPPNHQKFATLQNLANGIEGLCSRRCSLRSPWTCQCFRWKMWQLSQSLPVTRWSVTLSTQGPGCATVSVGRICVMVSGSLSRKPCNNLWQGWSTNKDLEKDFWVLTNRCSKKNPPVLEIRWSLLLGFLGDVDF